jgi:hypothetical protein
MSKFLLEYQMPYRPDGPVILHANVQDEDGNFDYPVGSEDFKPLAIFNDDAFDDSMPFCAEAYRNLCDWLHDAKPDYELAKLRAEAVRDLINATLNPVR